MKFTDYSEDGTFDRIPTRHRPDVLVKASVGQYRGR